MINNKAKGLFAEITPFQIRLARTDRTSYPMTVEALLAIPRGADPQNRDKMEDFALSRKSPFVQARCGSFPQGRFLHKYTLDNPGKGKTDRFAENTLQEQFNIKPEENSYLVLYPNNGRAFRPQETLAKELLFAGCSRKGLSSEQAQLIEEGIYPKSLEIQSLPLIAGVRSALSIKPETRAVFTIEFCETSSLSHIVGKQGVSYTHDFAFGFQDLVQTVQKELRLQDELSARRVLLSGTFDFRDSGSKLLSPLIRQVRASTGQFEVQTGKSIEYFYAPTLSKPLRWISEILADELGMEEWEPPLLDWMELCGLNLGQSVNLENDAAEWFPLFCLMADYSKETA